MDRINTANFIVHFYMEGADCIHVLVIVSNILTNSGGRGLEVVHTAHSYTVYWLKNQNEMLFRFEFILYQNMVLVYFLEGTDYPSLLLPLFDR